MKRHMPISLSRWTDVVHWYMPWLRDMVTVKGFVPAFDPASMSLQLWDLHPDEVLTLFFWTKNPKKLTTACQTWLSPYRVMTAVTITGWEEVETRVPPLQEQLDSFRRHIDVVGIEKVIWRYSPVPSNEKHLMRFEKICKEMSVTGIRHVDVALLQPSPHWDTGYSDDPDSEFASRIKVLQELTSVANLHNIQVGVCADDIALLEYVPAAVETQCLNLDTINQVFGLDKEHFPENGCGCQSSIDPCQGKPFGCASACEYCYVPFTTIKKA
jgi:hypothetical protein